jgi:RNA dependent RNA polymerase.
LKYHILFKLNSSPDSTDDLLDPELQQVELIDWSRPLQTSKLSTQLLTMLEDRGVPRLILHRLIQRDLKSVSDLVETVQKNDRNLCRVLLRTVMNISDSHSVQQLAPSPSVLERGLVIWFSCLTPRRASRMI